MVLWTLHSDGLHVIEPEATMEAFRSVMMGPVHDPLTGSPKIIAHIGLQNRNRIHHNTLDSMKYSMVARFAQIPREESTLACTQYSKIQHVIDAEGGFNNFVFILIIFTYAKNKLKTSFFANCSFGVLVY